MALRGQAGTPGGAPVRGARPGPGVAVYAWAIDIHVAAASPLIDRPVSVRYRR